SVRRTIVKKHNAEIHSQSAIDAAIAVRANDRFDAGHFDAGHFDADKVAEVRVTTFQVAYDIIGGGEEGDKRNIRSKEEADHSLPYMIAVALLDGKVDPEQYAPERIAADDVQRLLHRVTARPDDEFSSRFPAQMPAAVEVELTDGTVLDATADSYEGFHSDPLDWAAAVKKFDRLVLPHAGDVLADEIAAVVGTLEQRRVTDLTSLLAKVHLQRKDSPR